ncbi:MAG: hypothetical protein ACO39C_07635, partial [Chthoniobacterales bacterium]
VVRGGPKLPRLLGTKREGRAVQAEFETSGKLSRADLIHTADTTSPWKDRVWHTAPAEIKGSKIHAEVPSEARLYYIAVQDDRGSTVTTDYEELP